MKSFEFSAKTVDKAIKEGLLQLGKKQEDVDIQIISEGGFLKKAKVIISFDDEIAKTNCATPLQQNEKRQVDAKAPQKANDAQQSQVVAPSQNLKEIDKAIDVEQQNKQEKIATNNYKNQQKTDKKPQKTAKKSANTPKTQQEIEEKERLFAEKHFKDNTTSVQFVDGLLKAMGVTATVELTEKRDCSEVEVQTEDAGKVIGYRGDCLSAIQYLANIIETKQSPNAKRVVVDAGDYKERREQKLRELAIKVASKVESTGRAYKFEPMNAFERRIIHNELHNYQSVETHSEGIEPHRRLIVTKKAQ